MRITRPVLGKILQHSQGLGVASPETVRRRAQELAVIDGRDVYTDQDWKRAFHELHGGNHDTGDSNGHGLDDEMKDAISERDMIAPSLGHHVGRMEMEGGDCIGEELVAEGLDEAAHDHMLQAHQRDESKEEPDEEQT
jgi:hypothetical protein